MARLPRLALAGLAHLVIQRGHNGQAVFVDDDDRRVYLRALREAATPLGVAVHAYALANDAVYLLVTPSLPVALSRLMQALGRRYVAAFNRRHHRAGTLWDGRFRAAVVEAGDTLLQVMRCVEQRGDAGPSSGAQGQALTTSAPHHLGWSRDSLISEPAAYWQLGNTPFEREHAWQRLLSEPLPDLEALRIVDSALKRWARVYFLQN
ncbi:MAG: transposase [Burkholderiales bacterium]